MYGTPPHFAWVGHMISKSTCTKTYQKYLSFSIIKTYHSVSLFSQSAEVINRWLLLSQPVIIFTARKLFQARSQSKEWSLSKPNRPGHPAGSFGLAFIQLLRHTHTFVFAQSHTDSYPHKHIRHATLPGDLWLEPAALTQQYINHWALSSPAGPQCHAELDSTGIKSA